jgi:hypothetical protein
MSSTQQKAISLCLKGCFYLDKANTLESHLGKAKEEDYDAQKEAYKAESQ